MNLKHLSTDLFAKVMYLVPCGFSSWPGDCSQVSRRLCIVGRGGRRGAERVCARACVPPAGPPLRAAGRPAQHRRRPEGPAQHTRLAPCCLSQSQSTRSTTSSARCSSRIASRAVHLSSEFRSSHVVEGPCCCLGCTTCVPDTMRLCRWRRWADPRARAPQLLRGCAGACRLGSCGAHERLPQLRCCALTQLCQPLAVLNKTTANLSHFEGACLEMNPSCASTKSVLYFVSR